MAQQEDLEQPDQRGKSEETRTILIVEDDAGIGEVLVQAIVQETKHLAVLVQDGAEALKVVNHITPHLCILDYHLPHLNGIELYDHLQAIPALTNIPTIMVSARLPYKELATREIMGMNKPIDLDEFLQTIEQCLDEESHGVS